eukprot:gene756-1441_t
MKDKRGWHLWDARQFANLTSLKEKPNILLILADDLGYGDTSLAPFTIPKGPNWPCDEGGILTPQLEKMAQRGVTLTNFHSAAPVCSPARAAIMTGLYSYRLNALNAFELGRDLSQRNGFLPQVPTGAEIFREAGYFTAHVGKWHLGGMREEFRQARLNGDCSRPGPNQHGFEEYVSMLDGPQSPRYTFLNRDSILHSQGHNYMIKDDIPLPPTNKPAVLSDVEAQEAIRIMKEHAVKRSGQPWFMQLWFNAPHGPWELLNTGQSIYESTPGYNTTNWQSQTCWAGNDRPREPILSQRMWQYKTMITAMDRSIGLVMDALKALNIDDNTLVVFTSDNGQERGAGTAGIYMEGKRSLMEGGIRVPCVIQWPGVIPANETISTWTAQTDLIPTFLEAAGIIKPKDIYFDGLSMLSLLKQKSRMPAKPGGHSRKVSPEMQKRLYLWHRDTEPYDGADGRINSAGVFEHMKVITREKMGYIYRIFDLRADPLERNNLVTRSQLHFDTAQPSALKAMIKASGIFTKCAEGAIDKTCALKYHDHAVAKVSYIISKLKMFVRQGNAGHEYYMKHYEKSATCDVPIASKPLRICSTLFQQVQILACIRRFFGFYDVPAVRIYMYQSNNLEAVWYNDVIYGRFITLCILNAARTVYEQRPYDWLSG